MKKSLLVASLLLASIAQAQLKPMSLAEAESLTQNPTEEIQNVLEQTPKEYSFYNDDDVNTVNYLGQVMRQVLINDLKMAFGSYNRGQMRGEALKAFSELNSFYRYDFEKDGLKPFLISAKSPTGGSLAIYEGMFYLDIFPRKIDLQSKMAGVDNSLRHGKLLGWNTPEFDGVKADADGDGVLTPNDLMLSFMVLLSENIADENSSFSVQYPDGSTEEITEAHITASGLDLAQMAQKFLHAAVSFSQAAGDYLSVDLDPAKRKGLLADNTEQLSERSYTVLQHHWDEAFGYFGAARNYLDYTDQEIRSKVSKDAYFSDDVFDSKDNLLYADQTYGDLDGEISLQSEMNFALSQNAAKRDLGAKLGNVNFTETIMTRLLRGRQLVQERPEGYLLQAQAEATLLIAEWEKLIGATVVHYINETLKDYQKYSSKGRNFKSLAKHFSEMKGFALAFQFNPNSQIPTAEFEKMHVLMGDHPVNPMKGDVGQYQQNLLEARDLLQKHFKFDVENVEAW